MNNSDLLQRSIGLAAFLLCANANMSSAAEAPGAGLSDDANTRQEIKERAPALQARKLVNISSDGRFYVCAGRDGRVRFGRTENGIVLRTLYLCRPEVVALSPDGRFIAGIGNFNGCTSEIKVWNADDGSLVALLEAQSGGESLLFSADGLFLASAGESAVELWNLETGTKIWTRTMPRKILRVAFAEGQLVLICGEGKMMQFALH